MKLTNNSSRTAGLKMDFSKKKKRIEFLGSSHTEMFVIPQEATYRQTDPIILFSGEIVNFCCVNSRKVTIKKYSTCGPRLQRFLAEKLIVDRIKFVKLTGQR